MLDDARFQTLLAFFKTLADESRLRILGQLAQAPAGVEELAAMLGLKPEFGHHSGALLAATN